MEGGAYILGNVHETQTQPCHIFQRLWWLGQAERRAREVYCLVWKTVTFYIVDTLKLHKNFHLI